MEEVKKMKNKFFYIIDNGHGGLKGSQYVNAPDKMYDHGNGKVIYEGVFNRSVVKKLSYLLGSHGIPFAQLVPEQEDISLNERVKRINKLHDFYKERGMQTVLISIHGNAGGGTGVEVFTTKGETLSDPIADVFMKEMSKVFPCKRQRVDLSDGDLDKEVNFSILMCKGSAILTENFFMDNEKDCELMLSNHGQDLIALAHFNFIQQLESGVELKIKKQNKKSKKT